MIDLQHSYRIYFVTATLGAHSNFSNEGFRQKDVRFLIGLFLNWMDSTTKGVDSQIHNTQISRYLENLIRAGFATRLSRGRQPQYQLTRGGLLDLVTQAVQVPVHAPLEQFFFVFYFIRTYGARLTELVAQKENQLPRSFQLELAALLDTKNLLEQQIRSIQLEIKKLEVRLQETKGAAILAKDLTGKGAKPEEVVRAVEQFYPYELNSHKAMSDLFREIPATLRTWELTVGNENRANILWANLKDYLQNYLNMLMKLRAQEKE